MNVSPVPSDVIGSITFQNTLVDNNHLGQSKVAKDKDISKFSNGI